ncbi:MAG TPA: serine/threonine-protein kinase [Kofleriaceae bacterium]|nr:serine/threonine-protein kinase [Kofleriaceae bacterium]
MIRCQRCGTELEADARFCGACGATLVDPDLGRVIGQRYALRERIGGGSLGVVYRAEQLGTGRKLAIKLLADAARDPATAQRFRREGEVLCRLRSPHTITTYEVGAEDDGALYIAMELSPGVSLAELLRGEAPLPWPRALRILADLCDALAEAHALGVIHRDLKPENIMVETRPNRSDYAKVLDFGLAKVVAENARLSPPGQTIAAIAYCSPEQLRREPIDGRSDLYALGVLGYTLVTGHHPFPAARSYGDLVAAHLQLEPAPAADVPPEVDAILACCLAKQPARRYPDAAALAATIGVALAGAPADAGDTIREPPAHGDEDTVLAETPKRE